MFVLRMGRMWVWYASMTGRLLIGCAIIVSTTRSYAWPSAHPIVELRKLRRVAMVVEKRDKVVVVDRDEIR